METAAAKPWIGKLNILNSKILMPAMALSFILFKSIFFISHLFYITTFLISNSSEFRIILATFLKAVSVDVT